MGTPMLSSGARQWAHPTGSWGVPWSPNPVGLHPQPFPPKFPLSHCLGSPWRGGQCLLQGNVSPCALPMQEG